MPFPSADDFDRPDSELRLLFLTAVYDLLTATVNEPRGPGGETLIVTELIGPMRNAFLELELEEHFHRLYAATLDLQAKQLFEHGLGGAQLRFKLSVISYRETTYNRLGGIFRFRWLLDTFEGLLDSIIDAAGVGGAIKEFKEGIRNSGEDNSPVIR